MQFITSDKSLAVFAYEIVKLEARQNAVQCAKLLLILKTISGVTPPEFRYAYDPKRLERRGGRI